MILIPNTRLYEDMAIALFLFFFFSFQHREAVHLTKRTKLDGRRCSHCDENAYKYAQSRAMTCDVNIRCKFFVRVLHIDMYNSTDNTIVSTKVINNQSNL